MGWGGEVVCWFFFFFAFWLRGCEFKLFSRLGYSVSWEGVFGRVCWGVLV